MAREYQCSACEFMIRSEAEDELIDFVRQHADEVHELSMSADDVREGWTSV